MYSKGRLPATDTMRRVPARLLIHLRRLMRHDPLLLALLAVLVGGMAAGGAIVFRTAISAFQFLAYGSGDVRVLDRLEQLAWWHILLGPCIGGLALGLFQRWTLPEGRPMGVPDVIVQTGKRRGRLPFRAGMAAALASAGALGAGASVGREGPVVHLGAVLASWLGGTLRLSSGLMRTLLGCGVASAVAASFNAPLAGVFFAIEVVVGQYGVAAFAPVVLASVTGTAISRGWYGDFPAFILPANQLGSLWELPVFALLGFGSALIAVVFIRSIFLVDDLFKSWAPTLALPRWAWPGVGGLGVGLLAQGFPEVLGVGYELTDRALQGALPLGLLAALLLAKLLATALSLGSGFSGGVFSPSLAVGALAGGAFGWLVAAVLPDGASGPGTYATVGMGAVAGAVLGAPISTILIVFEMTADYGVTTAVMVGTVTAAMAMARLTGHSIFQLQLERRGLSPAPQVWEPAVPRRACVGDVMGEPVPSITAEAGLDDILSACWTTPGGLVPVTDTDGRLVGLLAPVDLAAALAQGAGPITAQDLARPSIPLLEAGDEAGAALALMADRDLSWLPVVDARATRRLIGIVRERDIHRAIGPRDQAAAISTAA
jgi:CIC family chloride channel protein